LKTQIGNRHSGVAGIRETGACNGTVIAMEAAPRSELDVLGIKKVCSGKRREVFQTLDWDKMLPATSLPNWQTPESMTVASA